MNGPPSKAELISAWQEYVRLVEDRSSTERQMNNALGELVMRAPHSYVSDLLQSGERRRTEDEALDEAVFRERLWHEEGQAALITHITSQLTEALDRPGLTERQRHYCENMLRHLWGECQ